MEIKLTAIFFTVLSWGIDSALSTELKHQTVSRQRKSVRDIDNIIKSSSNANLSRNERDAVDKFPTRIKYMPFKMPDDYNKYQIPSLGYVVAFESKFKKVDSFDVFDIMSHTISVTLRIYDVSDVDEITERITFSADLVLEWQDFVLEKNGLRKYNISSDEEFGPEDTDPLFKTLDPTFLDLIWTPDIFFESLVKVSQPEIMAKPATLRLNEITGEIIYISRLRIQLECQMKFQYYPADTQTCNIEIRSHSYSEDEINLEWSDPFGIVLEDCGGPNFDFQLANTGTEQKPVSFVRGTTRSFSGLQFSILARRKLSYHLSQTYAPSIFFIVITWLCFMIPVHMIETRIGAVMTTLLTLTSMFGTVRESSPPVSYVRAIDIWMVTCIFFVFLTLLEFACLLWLRNSIEANSEKNRSKMAPSHQNHDDVHNVVEKEGPEIEIRSRETKMRKRKLDHIVSELIESYSFIVFSVMFIVFNILYWSWILIGSDYFAWEVDPERNLCTN